MLKANRGQSQPQGQEAPPTQQYQQAPPTQQYQEAPPAQPQYQQAPPTYQPPSVPQSNTPARVSGTAIADMNAGVLDNIEDLSMGGNYVTVDGSDFLYKDTSETAKEIDIVVSYGKRFYQWFDEENQQHHNSDTKLDNRYRLKFEIKWFEDRDGEPVEYTLTLATTSAISFINYIQELTKQGLRVNQVVTRMTISRQTRQGSNDRYSRVEFQTLGLVQG